jgi:hypothetical protein
MSARFCIISLAEICGGGVIERDRLLGRFREAFGVLSVALLGVFSDEPTSSTSEFSSSEEERRLSIWLVTTKQLGLEYPNTHLTMFSALVHSGSLIVFGFA